MKHPEHHVKDIARTKEEHPERIREAGRAERRAREKGAVTANRKRMAGMHASMTAPEVNIPKAEAVRKVKKQL